MPKNTPTSPPSLSRISGTSNPGDAPTTEAIQARPKTPRGVTTSSDDVTLSAPRYPNRDTSADNVPLFETPCRVSACASSIDEGTAGKGSRSRNSNCRGGDGAGGVGDDDGFEIDGFQTPAPKGVSCAICLSPLVKSGGKEVYTVQLCRHNFHRGCLAENRGAGNIGCPYCRGTLEQGLTPEATAAERKALAVTARRDDQRQAIRNAAGRARMALARSLRRHQAEDQRAQEAAGAAPASDGSRGDPALLTI